MKIVSKMMRIMIIKNKKKRKGNCKEVELRNLTLIKKMKMQEKSFKIKKINLKKRRKTKKVRILYHLQINSNQI